VSDLFATLGDAGRSALAAMADASRWVPLLRAVLLIALGVLLAVALRRILARVMRNAPPHGRALMGRVVTWTVVVVFVVSALRELGFDFTVVLGAAGILTAAAAFASQTSASNVISGLFLGLEGNVQVGDVITVNGVTGEVLAIDLLSTRLRTFDNLMVRIPNETMVKADITNLQRFPIRRYDLRVGVAYGSDLQRVRDVLMEVADRHPLILEEPAPLIIAQGFGASSIDLQFSVWVRREAYLEVRNAVQKEVKEAFDRSGIQIPFPHVALQTVATPGAEAPTPATGGDRDEDASDERDPGDALER
jgi:small-conductance mechanosensitive channel